MDACSARYRRRIAGLLGLWLLWPLQADAARMPRCRANERLCPLEYGSTRFICVERDSVANCGGCSANGSGQNCENLDAAAVGCAADGTCVACFWKEGGWEPARIDDELECEEAERQPFKPPPRRVDPVQPVEVPPFQHRMTGIRPPPQSPFYIPSSPEHRRNPVARMAAAAPWAAARRGAGEQGAGDSLADKKDRYKQRTANRRAGHAGAILLDDEEDDEDLLDDEEEEQRLDQLRFDDAALDPRARKQRPRPPGAAPAPARKGPLVPLAANKAKAKAEAEREEVDDDDEEDVDDEPVAAPAQAAMPAPPPPPGGPPKPAVFAGDDANALPRAAVGPAADPRANAPAPQLNAALLHSLPQWLRDKLTASPMSFDSEEELLAWLRKASADRPAPAEKPRKRTNAERFALDLPPLPPGGIKRKKKPGDEEREKARERRMELEELRAKAELQAFRDGKDPDEAIAAVRLPPVFDAKREAEANKALDAAVAKGSVDDLPVDIARALRAYVRYEDFQHVFQPVPVPVAPAAPPPPPKLAPVPAPAPARPAPAPPARKDPDEDEDDELWEDLLDDGLEDEFGDDVEDEGDDELFPHAPHGKAPAAARPPPPVQAPPPAVKAPGPMRAQIGRPGSHAADDDDDEDDDAFGDRRVGLDRPVAQQDRGLVDTPPRPPPPAPARFEPPAPARFDPPTRGRGGAPKGGLAAALAGEAEDDEAGAADDDGDDGADDEVEDAFDRPVAKAPPARAPAPPIDQLDRRPPAGPAPAPAEQAPFADYHAAADDDVQPPRDRGPRLGPARPGRQPPAPVPPPKAAAPAAVVDDESAEEGGPAPAAAPAAKAPAPAAAAAVKQAAKAAAPAAAKQAAKAPAAAAAAARKPAAGAAKKGNPELGTHFVKAMQEALGDDGWQHFLAALKDEGHVGDEPAAVADADDVGEPDAAPAPAARPAKPAAAPAKAAPPPVKAADKAAPPPAKAAPPPAKAAAPAPPRVQHARPDAEAYEADLRNEHVGRVVRAGPRGGANGPVPPFNPRRAAAEAAAKIPPPRNPLQAALREQAAAAGRPGPAPRVNV